MVTEYNGTLPSRYKQNNSEPAPRQRGWSEPMTSNHYVMGTVMDFNSSRPFTDAAYVRALVAASSTVSIDDREYGVAVDDIHGGRRWSHLLSWQSWCKIMGGEPSHALRTLRSHSPSGYRLDTNKYGIHFLLFKSQDDAQKVAHVVCAQVPRGTRIEAHQSVDGL